MICIFRKFDRNNVKISESLSKKYDVCRETAKAFFIFASDYFYIYCIYGRIFFIGDY